MMKHDLQIEIVPSGESGYQRGPKRTYLPFHLWWTCPVCKLRHDLLDNYLSHPPIGVPFTKELYCEHLDPETWNRIVGIPEDAPGEFVVELLLTYQLEVV